MSNLSNILNSKYPSPTTFIAALSSAGTSSVTYTPTSPAKVNIFVTSSSTVTNITVGGVSMDIPQNYANTFYVCVGAGQSLTISVPGTGAKAIVSAEWVK